MIERARQAEARRLQPRVDLRLVRALAGALRHLLRTCSRPPPQVHGRTDGHQPGDAGLVRHGVDVRHPERHVRQPDGLRHRPRRLGASRHRRAARRRCNGFAEAITTIKDLAEGREAVFNGVTSPAPLGDRQPPAGLGRRLRPQGAAGRSASAPTASSSRSADPDIARWTIESGPGRRRAAGREPDELTICVAAPAYVGDDIAHQREQLRWFGGMVGNHVADLVARYGESSEVPTSPHRLRARAPRATTTATTGGQTTRRSTSCPTTSSTGSASLGSGREPHRAARRSCPRSASTSSPST